MNRNVNYRDIVKSFDRTGQTGPALDMTAWNAAVAAAAANAGQACNLVDAGQGTARVMPAGFDEFCIDSCEVEIAETTICAPYILTGCYIDPSIACHLSVRNLTVCRWQGFGNCNWIPASFFACCDATAAFEMWSCKVPANSKVCMEVRNDSNRDGVKFKGNLITAICDSTCNN